MADMNASEQQRKCSVLAAAFFVLGCSMMFAQSADSGFALRPRFDVASVRQNLTPEPRWRMSFTDDGVSGEDITLLYVVQESYGLYDEQLWSGIPQWIKETRFDIEAKYDVEKYPQITL